MCGIKKLKSFKDKKTSKKLLTVTYSIGGQIIFQQKIFYRMHLYPFHRLLCILKNSLC